MLREGIAEYLSKPETAFALPEDARADFPARLRAGIGEEPTDYPAAMHFVGALVTTHGLEKYLDFHTRVRKHARWRGFERAYREIYGGDLATDLEAMAELPITGHVPDAPGLCRGFGVIEPWEAMEPGHSGEAWATRLRRTIAEAPPPPEAPARPWLCAQVGVEVEVAGFYAVLLVDEGGELPRGPVGGLWGCPGSYEGAGFVPNSEVFTYLSEGRFYIDLQVPPRPLEAAPLAVEIELVKPARSPAG